jgi:hypothetical protein
MVGLDVTWRGMLGFNYGDPVSCWLLVGAVTHSSSHMIWLSWLLLEEAGLGIQTDGWCPVSSNQHIVLSD